MALTEPAAITVGTSSIALTIATVWGGPFALAVAVVPVAVYVASSDRVQLAVHVDEDESSPRNPDYYCTRCGRDRESGGEPAVCSDCRDSAGEGDG